MKRFSVRKMSVVKQIYMLIGEHVHGLIDSCPKRMNKNIKAYHKSVYKISIAVCHVFWINFFSFFFFRRQFLNFMEVAFLKFKSWNIYPFHMWLLMLFNVFLGNVFPTTDVGKSCNCVQNPPQWLWIIIFMHSEDLTKQNENICFATVIWDWKWR